MFERLEITRMAQAMAAHAGSRMGVIAQNVANADTPGYKAKDLPDFAATYALQQPDSQMRATRPGHFGKAQEAMPVEPQEVRGGTGKLNGNTVSLETEMVHAAEVRQMHDMALSIYRSSSDILKLALGRGGR